MGSVLLGMALGLNVHPVHRLAHRLVFAGLVYPGVGHVFHFCVAGVRAGFLPGLGRVRTVLVLRSR
jgi:hypothetical protein